MTGGCVFCIYAILFPIILHRTLKITQFKMLYNLSLTLLLSQKRLGFNPSNNSNIRFTCYIYFFIFDLYGLLFLCKWFGPCVQKYICTWNY